MTVVVSLTDSSLPPIEQSSASFFSRIVIDSDNLGLSFRMKDSSVQRCQAIQKKVVIMGNHGVIIIRDSVFDSFNRKYYFKRAVETYSK